MQHTHALALAGRRILSRTDSDGGSASKTGKSVRTNLSHTLPVVVVVVTATSSAGATASLHSDAQPGPSPEAARAAEFMKACDDRR